jgi:hypothetical protein
MVARGSINGSEKAATRATAASKITPAKAPIQDLRLRFARKPAKARVRITVTAIRVGISAIPSTSTARVAKSPGVSSMTRWETAVSTEGTSW